MNNMKRILVLTIVKILILSQFIIMPSQSFEITDFHQNNASFLPEDFKVGDLIFIESVSFWHNVCNGWDHVAMYIGDNLFIEANNYSEIPKPIGGTVGVQITPLWKYQLWIQYCTFATVKSANESQRMAAVEWAKEQLGDDNFQTAWGDGSWWANANPNDKSDPDASNFYCAELIWAAYYNTSNGEIDLDVKPGPLPPPSGDGIHFAVSPQEIERDENVSLYSVPGAPSAPTRPDGYPKKVTLPQFGIYTTNSTDDKDLFYQWAWGDSIKPDSWRKLSWHSDKNIKKMHFWNRLSIHDRLDNNFVFDVRVRCKDKYGRVSNWSDPLPVHVTPNFYQGNWVSPTGHIDTAWNREEKVYDRNTISSSSVYSISDDNEWSDSPLILTLDEPISMKGFRLKASKRIFHDEIKICLYNGSEHVITFNYSNWPNKRWKIVDYHRFNYEIDRVEIWFHISDNFKNRDFFNSPIKVYGFSFWEYDGYW